MAGDIVHANNLFPVAICNSPYEVAIAFQGNASPITGSAIVSGSLPSGLALDTGPPWTRISGIPTTNGLYTFQISLTDTAGTVISPQMSIRVLTSGIDDWLYRNAATNVAITWPGTE